MSGSSSTVIQRRRGATRRGLWLAGASLLLGSAARAQTTAAVATAAADSSSVSEVVVTAERRETNLQKTPIAISAFTPATLRDRNAESVRDLAGQIPNLYIARTNISYTTQTYSLRGVGETDPIQEPVLAVYVDDTYIPRQIGSMVDFNDVQRIEVLRGPQGTLYGRNSSAGALRIVTLDPQQHPARRHLGGARRLRRRRGPLDGQRSADRRQALRQSVLRPPQPRRRHLRPDPRPRRQPCRHRRPARQDPRHAHRQARRRTDAHGPARPQRRAQLCAGDPARDLQHAAVVLRGPARPAPEPGRRGAAHPVRADAAAEVEVDHLLRRLRPQSGELRQRRRRGADPEEPDPLQRPVRHPGVPAERRLRTADLHLGPVLSARALLREPRRLQPQERPEHRSGRHARQLQFPAGAQHHLHRQLCGVRRGPTSRSPPS